MNKAKTIEFINKNPLIILIIINFLTRLLFLKSLPIFNDEATYIDWGWRMINLKGESFHSVAHYKPPLFMWTVGIFRKLIPDPLVAGRLVSILSGLMVTLGLYKLGKALFNRKTALLSSFLYIITPIFLFFDRQALMESAVSAFGIWSLYLFIQLIKSQNPKYAAFLGFTLGFGFLVKTNAILFAIPLFAFYLWEYKKSKTKNQLVTNGLITVSSLLITTSPLILNNTFWQTLGKNKDYIFTLSELTKFPLTFWLNNLKNFLIITLLYLNPLIILFSTFSIYKSIKDKITPQILASIYLFSSWFFVFILGRSIIPRHIVSFLPPILIFTSNSFLEIYKKSKTWGSLLLFFTLIPFLILSIIQVISPIKYFNTLDKISSFSLKEEYVTHWSSGYGIEEVLNFLTEKAANPPIIVGVRLDAGNPENAIIAFTQGSKNIIPIYLDARMYPDFESYDCIKSKIPTYFISRDNQLAGLDKHLEEIKKVYKPEEKHYIGIYKVKTNCQGEKILNIFN